MKIKQYLKLPTSHLFSQNHSVSSPWNMFKNMQHKYSAARLLWVIIFGSTCSNNLRQQLFDEYLHVVSNQERSQQNPQQRCCKLNPDSFLWEWTCPKCYVILSLWNKTRRYQKILNWHPMFTWTVDVCWLSQAIRGIRLTQAVWLCPTWEEFCQCHP